MCFLKALSPTPHSMRVLPEQGIIHRFGECLLRVAGISGAVGFRVRRPWRRDGWVSKVVPGMLLAEDGRALPHELNGHVSGGGNFARIACRISKKYSHPKP